MNNPLKFEKMTFTTDIVGVNIFVGRSNLVDKEIMCLFTIPFNHPITTIPVEEIDSYLGEKCGHFFKVLEFVRATKDDEVNCIKFNIHNHVVTSFNEIDFSYMRKFLHKMLRRLNLLEPSE